MKKSICVIFLFVASISFSQTNIEQFNQIFSIDIQNKAGLSKLTSLEKQMLLEYVSTLLIQSYNTGINVNKAKASVNFIFVERGKYIKEKLDSGKMFILDTNDKWQVSTIDSSTSILWSRLAPVSIIQFNTGEFGLYNEETKESVVAKLVR